MQRTRNYVIEVKEVNGNSIKLEEKAISEKEALLKVMFRAERDGTASEYATQWQKDDEESEETRKVVTLHGVYKVHCKIH